MTTNVDAIQERGLADILARNGDAEYLAKCGLAGAGASDRATFRPKVPMATYDDLKQYNLRIANGDRSPILSGSVHPISEFNVSSGTSDGEPKLIPAVKDEERGLADILARNGDAEYLAKCGLAGAGDSDRATFRPKVPMAASDDLKRYNQRAANGDRSHPVILRHPISEFNVSSGTSDGEPKLIPAERGLADILARNGDAEYLAKCGLAGAGDSDRATFRPKVPMATYDDLKQYNLRITNGDRSPILSGSVHPISEFNVSSGTSDGEPKLISAVKDEVNCRMLLHGLVMAVMNQ
ncbi:unnamed protein product [Miscanthus lutarioriparius]|uniref:Uncharacterized protein n=1 Tax=Miscanthus lutarioriparius TaxID=422564 RepID=A0A811SSR8_9POAL|nr:unnamed protein product [Miscanthus lutarioriparius]